MLIADYFHHVEKVISASPAIISRELFFDERTHNVGLVKGILTFHDGSELHFKEFVDVSETIVKYKYAYHYQRDSRLIFRYDNHPIMFRNIPQQHKHASSEENIVECVAPDLEFVLNEVLSYLPA